jgi:hypothetical protein
MTWIDESRPVAMAAAGPIAVGAVLALRLQDVAPLVAVPVSVFAVTALTLPALYIATAVFGAAPPVGHVVRAVGRALQALGVVLLGVAMPLGFLVATAGQGASFALGALALAGAAAIGLRALHGALFEHGPAVSGRGLLFISWALIALVIGARLYDEMTLEVIR